MNLEADRDRERRKNFFQAPIIPAVMRMRAFGPLRTKKAQQKPEKPCIVCGRMKRHNNAFCSADCCKIHKAKKGKA